MALSLTDLQTEMLPVLWGAFPLPVDDATPWRELRAAEDGQDLDVLVRLLAGGALESMVAIRAARVLRFHGMAPPAATYGVVLAVPLDDWADILAVYADGHIRYYNGGAPTGGLLLDTPPDDQTTALLAAADAALGAAPVADLPSPVTDLTVPTGVLFRHDGEHAGILPAIPGGDAVLAAGAVLLDRLTS